MEPYRIIPTYVTETNTWTTTEFSSRQELYEFMLPLFKEPGKYEFDESTAKWNEEGKKWKAQGYYCNSPKNTTDFKNYWNTQKERCRKGVIYKNGNKTWYLAREYYMWLNFLPIYNKAIKEFTFADVRDIQYHMCLYMYLAELDFKHGGILKKRQICYSYLMCAKIYNKYVFERNAILKIGASQKIFINDEGTWKYLNEYRDFINEHTAWLRENDPNKPLNWYQRSQKEIWEGSTKKVIYKGKKSRITGMSFEKKPTAGVGGPTDIFWYEEGGIAPTADKTIKYIIPSMQDGAITTGIFIIGGSVGDLKDCGPLKKMIRNPFDYDIYPVKCDRIDNKGTVADRALFLPVQWSMPPFIDQHGNSLVEQALEYIRVKRIEDEKKMSPSDYQLSVSQDPTTIEEAFAARETSVFKPYLVQKQKRRIEDGEYTLEYVELERGFGEDGKEIIAIEKCNREPLGHPIDPKWEDKRGVICIHERPPKEIKHGMYYGSVDNVEEGTTTSSESAFSIHIYKAPVNVYRIDPQGKKTFHTEEGKLVAWWRGRYDDANQTNEQGLRLIELYQAYTITEANKPGFTNYVIGKNKQHFLVPKDQFTLLRDLKANEGTYQEYGWKNTGVLFKKHFIPMAVEWMEEALETVDVVKEGEPVRKITTRYGVERIGPDIMLLREMEDYQDGKNADAIISFCALIAFVKSQVANFRPISRQEQSQETKVKQKPTILRRSAFNNIGNGTKKSAFRNFR